MVDEAFESLAGTLASHAQLGADRTPRQTGTVRSDRGGFDARARHALFVSMALVWSVNRDAIGRRRWQWS